MLYINVKRSMTLRLSVLNMPSVFMFHTFQNIEFMFTNWHIKFSDLYHFLVLLNMPLCVERIDMYNAHLDNLLQYIQTAQRIMACLAVPKNDIGLKTLYAN
jgi:hypothetical protein